MMTTAMEGRVLPKGDVVACNGAQGVIRVASNSIFSLTFPLGECIEFSATKFWLAGGWVDTCGFRYPENPNEYMADFGTSLSPTDPS